MNRPVIIGIYLILGFGLLWQALDVLDSLRFYASSPVMAGVNLLVAWGLHQTLDKKYRSRFRIWAVFIFLFTFGLEYVGVHTGLVFGDYEYGSRVAPLINDVPAIIGLAWVGAIAGGFSVTVRVMRYFDLTETNDFLTALITAFAVMTFDLCLEPMAMHLDYWNWAGDLVPLQNYLVWFGVAFITVFAGLKFKVLELVSSPLATHGYIAQIIFFMIAAQI